MTNKVLVIEDTKSIARLLTRDLPVEGYAVFSHSHRRALHRVLAIHPDLVVLDLYGRIGNVPGICSAMHKVGRVPIIAVVRDPRLSALETEGVEYHAGAPNLAELVTRVQALISRPRQPRKLGSSQMIAVGDFLLDADNRHVMRDGKTHKLTPKALQLLQAFVANAGETLTRKQLMKDVWDTDYTGDTRTLDVHVRWIRVAIERKPGSPLYLRTVRRVGYRFEVPEPEPELPFPRSGVNRPTRK